MTTVFVVLLLKIEKNVTNFASFLWIGFTRRGKGGLLVKLPHRMKFFYEKSDSWKDSKKYPNRPAPDKVARSGAAKQKNDEYSGPASTRLEEKSEKFHYMNKLEQFIHI